MSTTGMGRLHPRTTFYSTEAHGDLVATKIKQATLVRQSLQTSIAKGSKACTALASDVQAREGDSERFHDACAQAQSHWQETEAALKRGGGREGGER